MSTTTAHHIDSDLHKRRHDIPNNDHGKDVQRDIKSSSKPSFNSPDMTTTVDAAPITHERPVPHVLDSNQLPDPWRPRAKRAVDMDHPQGTVGDYPSNDMSVLQQHVKFWDLNNDGIITPLETFMGFRHLGFNILVSVLAVFFINGTFSYPTQDSWVPDPLFRIKIKNSHRIKHGSDTGVYDTEGRFIPSKFEELFTKFARTNPRFLTLREAFGMTEGLRVAMDIYGWIAAKLEWATLFLLCGRRDASTGELVISKDDMRAQYDGTLFYRMRDERLKSLQSGHEHLPSILTAVEQKAVPMVHNIPDHIQQAQVA